MHVFISYARQDREFVRALHGALAAGKVDVWVDWEDIPPTAAWLAEVYTGIEAADTFLFVISPESAGSETCRLEIAHATKHNKRLIPIVRCEVARRDLPDAVSALNWVYFRPEDAWDTSLQTLTQGLDTDVEWVHTHTRLLVRALDWEKRAQDESLLLRGRDLRDAETALGSAAARSPAPTALQVQFVVLSRKRDNRRRRSAITAVTLAVMIASALGYAAWLFSEQRDIQRTRASANALTSQAQLVRDRGANMLPVSLLLALESKRIAPSAEADQLIRQALSMLPRPVGRLPHPHPVSAVAFSPDGNLLASAAEDEARIWDVATQQEYQVLGQSGDRAKDISALAFTPDGKSLVTAGTGMTIWDLTTGQRRRLADGESLDSLAISGDGKYVASGDHSGAVVVRDLVTGVPILHGFHGMIVNAVAWSRDNQFVASASNDKTARAWQVPGGQIVSLPHPGGGPRAVAWSPDGNWIATGGWEGLARVWERDSGREHARFDVKSTIQAVAFDIDGTHLIAAAADRTARVWDVTSGTESARMTHDGAVTALAISPDGRHVATGSADNTAALWDLGGGDETIRLAHPEGVVGAVAYSLDGKRLATVRNETVHVWELPAAREITRLEHAGRVHVVMFSPDGATLLTVAENPSANSSARARASIGVWDATSGQEVRQLPVRDTKVAFSRDGRYFAISNFRDGALVRDVEKGNDVTGITEDVVERFTSAVALSPDRRHLAASVNDGPKNYQTFIWDTQTGAPHCRFDHDGYVRTLAFSPDGLALAAGGIGTTARVWALDGCRDTARFASAEEIGAVAFSPDGTLLATGSRDHTVRVWSLEGGTELARSTFGGVVNDVAFSPDGRSVAAASSDRTARVWQWRPEEDTTAAVCTRVGRSLTPAEWKEYVGDAPYHETCAGLTGTLAGALPE